MDKSSETNYYRKFDECRKAIEEIYLRMSEEISEEYVDTLELDKNAVKILFDAEYINLKKFVRENLDAFTTAYNKPKQFLNAFVDNILRVKNNNNTKRRTWTLNSLRGYLDDSMINYITSGVKYVPKNKKTHISIGLALGMTIDDLDIYLKMMGYASLDGTYLEEGLLINFLEKWEESHPLQRAFKNKYIYNKLDADFKMSDEIQAINDMLKLRSEIKEMYENFLETSPNKTKNKKFPYMND